MATSTNSLLCALVLFSSSACAQLLGFEDVTADATDAAPADAMIDPLACTGENSAADIGTTLGNTDAESDEVQLTCGSAASNDRLFRWRAPATDYYVFDTLGSSFDTVLAIFDECDGTELACNNNKGEVSDSELVRKIEVDSELLLAVDGFAGASGDFSLNIKRVSCPDFDLERQTFPLSFTTANQGDDFFNECGGNGQPDRAFHWSAPSDGLYAFTAIAAGYRAVVTVIDGSRCSDQQLGCSQASEPAFKSEVVRRLSADQQVSVYIDGIEGSGNYDIDVRKVEATCPSQVLMKDDNLVGAYDTRSMSSSCSFVESRSPLNTPIELGDKTYQVEIPALSLGCFGSCDIDISSTGAFSAALLEGNNCSGAELACEQSVTGSVNLQVSLQEGAPQSRTLVVTDRDANNLDGFTVSLSCNEACP